MKRLLIFLFLVVGFGLAQQVNQDFIPASTGLKLGHSNQRWDAFLHNVDISGTCFINGVPCGSGSGGGVQVWPLGGPGIPVYNGAAGWSISLPVPDGNPTDCLVGTGVWASCGSGTLTGASTGGGLVVTGTTIGLRLDCTDQQVPLWNATGADWECASIPGGLGDPGGTGIVKRTTLNHTVVAVAADFPILNQNTTGNAATATALAATPTQCTGANFSTGIAANGNANCSVPPGGVSSVTGTANQIASSGGANPVLSIPNPFNPPGAVNIPVGPLNVGTNTPGIVDVQTQGVYAFEVANNATTGTTMNKTVCNDGTGKGIVCPHATSTTNQPLGFCVANCTTTGNATVSMAGWPLVIFDNTSVAQHYAINSTTIDGDLHDNGTALVAGQANFFVWTANSGAGTPGLIRMLIADDFNNSSLTGYATITNIQNQGYTCANDTGAANAYAATLAPTPTGTTYTTACFKAAHSNTTSSTLAIPGVFGGAATTIKKWSSGSQVNLASGDITTGQIITVISDGTFWNLLSGSGGSGGATPTAVVRIPIYFRNPQSSSNPGNSFPTVTALSNGLDWQHWEFVNGVTGTIFGTVVIPHNMDATPAATIICRYAATTGATANVRLQEGDFITGATDSYNGTFTTTAAQTVAIGAQWTNFSVTYTPNATLAADKELWIELIRIGGNAADTYAANLGLDGCVLQITEDF